MIKRLAIVSTHPIQYYAPVFRLLTENGMVQIKVFYTWEGSSQTKHDPGFGKTVEWDIPLLEGYSYEFLKNTSKNPGSENFNGIKNPEIITRLSNFKPDIILVFGWAYQSHLRVMRYFKGKVPIWFRGDSTLLNENIGLKGLFKSMLKKIILKWVYSHADKAFYVGQNNRSYFTEYGLKNNELIFAPHAVDNERFASNRTVEAKQLRRNLAISEQSTVVLFAGKLDTIKNISSLIKAFTSLDPDYHCHLIIAGNGKLEKALKSEARSNRKIHFLDFQNQSRMPVLYQACDLFCLPSQSESWGLSINEAMACGKAILASDKVGAAIDLILPNKNGLIFRADDLSDLKEKLVMLISNKSLLDQYGKRSKEIIKAWNFVSIASAIETQINNEPER